MSFLLKVKYIPATNFRGSRVCAKAEDDKLGTTISWHHEKNAQENYDAAVAEWIRRGNDPELCYEFIGEYHNDKFYRISK